MSRDHEKIGKLIAEMGLEKFLEVSAEQCAQFGSECRSKHTAIQNHMLAQWEMIGENLRALASSARSARIHEPFQIDEKCRMVRSSLSTDPGAAPVWKI